MLDCWFCSCFEERCEVVDVGVVLGSWLDKFEVVGLVFFCEWWSVSFCVVIWKCWCCEEVGCREEVCD